MEGFQRQERKRTLFQNLKLNSYSKDYDLSHDIIKRLKSNGLCLKYSKNDQFIAVGYKNGSLMIYDTKQKFFSNNYTSVNEVSITSLIWLSNSSKKENILISGDMQFLDLFNQLISDGQINYWSTEQTNKISTIKFQQGNSVLCMDSNFQIPYLAVGSKSQDISLFYQQYPHKQIILKKNSSEKNRLNSQYFTNHIKFINNSALLSTCTDNTLDFWDLRTGDCQSIIKNVQTFNDCFDLVQNQILTGNIKLQMRNLNGKIKKQINLEKEQINTQFQSYVNTARFSKYDPSLFAVGTAEQNSSLVIFKQDQNNIHKPILEVRGVQEKIISLQFANQSQQIAFTSGKKGFFVYDFGQEQQELSQQQQQTKYQFY